MDSLYVIIPAYNEEQTIETVAKEWHAVVEKTGPDSRLVIIDDGSLDNTYQKLRQLQTTLPQLEAITKPNSGHGATIYFGYRYALKKHADYIFQTDSDGQTLSSEFWDFWKQRTAYDALIGYRKNRKDGTSRIFVTKVLKLVVRLIFGVSIADANTPFRLLNNKTLKRQMEKIPYEFNLTNVMMSVFLVHGQESVKFIPITFLQRQGGVNSINFRRIIKIGKQAVKDFIIIKKAL